MRLKNIGIVFILTFMAACAASKKVNYEFPPEMSESVKSEFAKQCYKGEILFEINCAKCHSVTVKRKKVIPDFEQEHLMSYELRITNPMHENNLPETIVSAEELGLIMTFLSYKKKSGIPAKGK